MKKIFFFVIIQLFFTVNIFAQKQTRANNTRSDSAHIVKIILNITNIDKVNKIITANATLNIKSKINNLQNVLLDLEGLTIDSIFENNVIANYTYTSPTINILLNTALQNGDSTSIKIYYHGTPIVDATWGGFYFNGVYAFNLGVGFTSQPHVIGRYLFPCFDNFVERSKYEFNITTSATDMAVCNGMLIDSSFDANNNFHWHWVLSENIPSYLVSVAVAPYVLVKKNLTSIYTNKEAWIACLATDSNNVNASFAHLQNSFDMLESHFGKYNWEKVGYSLVPFNAGAMEHATNIHIGKAFIDGTLNYETLIAHELSHHWFGDLATCKTAQDMWLNEGFASYCEMLHTEYVYGKTAYTTAYTNNHLNILNSAHINDDAYKAVSNMDSLHTYGTTVYNKGADMLHTLRSYLGDSLFFNGLKYYLSQHNFDAVNTNDLKNSLSTYSGINLNDYFNDWINQPGFANFCIDSTQTIQEGSNWKIKVFVRQRKHKNTNYYNNVMLPISIFNKDFSHITIRTNFTQQCKVYNFTLPFEPAFVCIDEDNLISDASTFNTQTIKTNGWKIFTDGKAKARIYSVTDSTLLRIEHHWVAPDRFKIPQGNYILNDARYWQVNGINLQNIVGYLQFAYSTNSSNFYLDSNWLQASEAGIRLFYRKDATQDWQFANDSLVAGSVTDKIGFIFSKEIKAGEYALGILHPGYIDTIVTDAPNSPCTNIDDAINDLPLKNKLEDNFILYPNPNQGKINLQCKQLNSQTINIIITDTFGKIMKQDNIKPYQAQTILNCNFPNGTYQIQFFQNNILIQTTPFLISN